jgi:hypothetical protein
LVHTGTAKVYKIGDRLIWDLPGRRIVVFARSAGQRVTQ